jgi:membrane protease YdiL (CAAX protease family)
VARLLEATGSFFFVALPAIAFAFITNRSSFQFIGFNKLVSGKQVFLIIVIIFMALIVSGALSELNERIPISKEAAKYFQSLEDEYNKEMAAIANMKSSGDYILSLLLLGFLPALFEEMFFRGCLQQVMIGLAKNTFTAIFITSALFSAIHFSYYGFLPRLFLGLILGYIFYYSKNIWQSILAHFLINAFALTEMYSESLSGKPVVDSAEDHFPFYYGVIGIIAVIFLLRMFKKESQIVISLNILKLNDQHEGMG